MFKNDSDIEGMTLEVLKTYMEFMDDKSLGENGAGTKVIKEVMMARFWEHQRGMLGKYGLGKLEFDGEEKLSMESTLGMGVMIGLSMAKVIMNREMLSVEEKRKTVLILLKIIAEFGETMNDSALAKAKELGKKMGVFEVESKGVNVLKGAKGGKSLFELWKRSEASGDSEAGEAKGEHDGSKN